MMRIKKEDIKKDSNKISRNKTPIFQIKNTG